MTTTVTVNSPNRWFIAIMGTILQLCLGTVYAWSFFQKLLVTTYGWTNSQTAWTFSIAICALGLAAAWGGINLPKYGPQRLAISGGLLFGVGYLLGALALHLQSLALLYIGYGLIGGIGLGLGYVTPVATVAKWFPDKKGLVTGMVIMGFGLGALLMSKVFAPMLIAVSQSASAPDGNLVIVFGALGVIFMVLTVVVSTFLKNPPSDYVPAGWTPPTPTGKPEQAVGMRSEESYPTQAYLLSGKFIMMWVVFFCNIVAGIAIIGFQSPLLQGLFQKRNPSLDAMTLAAYGATLIAISSLFNGIGRFFWGGLADRMGRVQVFRLMLLSQIVVFAVLVFTQNPWIFSISVCYVLLCYGGGFGSMPSFVLDVFGIRMMPVVYGFMLTAWAAAGVVGPQIVAVITDRFPAQASMYSFAFGTGFLIMGFVLSLFLNNSIFSPKLSSLRE